MSGRVVVAARELRKSYGAVRALDGVSFSVAAGEVFGIVGPNGSGKTTTVECLVGLRCPDAGELRVLGLDPRRNPVELRRRVGVQLQEAALPDDIKVWEALALFASLYPRPADWKTLLREWGLEEKRTARFSDLSGGLRQRLFVALALVSRPEVVILDELTAGLDPQARRASRDLVELMRARGITVILVTHWMEEAEALCDRVAVFRLGRIVALDSPRRLIDRARRRAGGGPPSRSGRFGLEDAFMLLTAGGDDGREREVTA